MNSSKVKIPVGYRFVELPFEEFPRYWAEWGKKIFSDNDTSADMSRLISDVERENLRGLQKNLSSMFRMNLCIFKGDEFCGWFTGDQYNGETFYMRNSAILPAHRRQGLYTALMHEVLSRVENLGFQVVLSRHSNTNSSIIIPKLKAGFIITAMELSDKFGTLVHLSYFFNENRRKLIEFRAGERKPDTTMRQAIGID